MTEPLSHLCRLLRLVDELQSGRLLNTADLARICGVSRRTIFRDLRSLQDCGFRVHYDAARQGYYLPRRTYLPPAEFTLDEALSLMTVCQSVSESQHGIPFQDAARHAFQKLHAILPGSLRDRVGELPDSIHVRLEPHNPLLSQEQYYHQLIACIREQKCVRLAYQSLTPRARIETRLSPFQMLYSRRSWYVVGRSSMHRAVRMFNVGRIETLTVLEQTFRRPTRFAIERYLGNAWHLIREKPYHQRVVIRFSPLVATNVAEVQWHRTQQNRFEPDGSLRFEVIVDGLREISWWILGYGDQAEVLEPPELRTLIGERVRAMSAKYPLDEPELSG